MKVKIDQLMTHTDRRGLVFEPIEKNSITTQRNCHVVISQPGVIRGNHYHVKGTETIAVAGPAKLRFKEGQDIIDVEVPAEQVYKFIIPPGVAHAIKNTSEKAGILVAFNSHAHDPGNPDCISDVLIAE